MRIPLEVDRQICRFTRELKPHWPGAKRRRWRLWDDQRELQVGPYSRGKFLRIRTQWHDGRGPSRELTFLPSEIHVSLAWAIAWLANPDARFPGGSRGHETYAWSIDAAAQATLGPGWRAAF